MAKKGLPLKKAEGKTTPVPVKIVNSTDSVASPRNDEAREREWRAKSALEDIERAEGHKRDKNLMGDVKKLAKEKVKSLNKIC